MIDISTFLQRITPHFHAFTALNIHRKILLAHPFPVQYPYGLCILSIQTSQNPKLET